MLSFCNLAAFPGVESGVNFCVLTFWDIICVVILGLLFKFLWIVYLSVV